MSGSPAGDSRVVELPRGIVVLERGWLSSNNLVLVGREQAAVVDTGYGTHGHQTAQLVEQALGGRALDLVLNTHLHSDHCGGNAALQARWPEVQTLIPPGHQGDVRAWDTVALTYEPTGQWCPQFQMNGVLEPGSSCELGDSRWLVLPAPGHDPHSVILFQPESRTLASADALWEHGFGVVFPELDGDAGFDEVASTLELIERLSPAIIVPGHGPVFTDVEGALRRARSRLESFRTQPARHANHAAKVLLKFKLLDLQSTTLEDLVHWAATTQFLRTIHARWIEDKPFEQWLIGLTGDLERAGAVTMEGEVLRNA